MKNTFPLVAGVGFFSGDSTMQMLLPIPSSYTAPVFASSAHFYRFTASNCGADKLKACADALPAKYSNALFASGWCDGTDLLHHAGSASVTFKCDARLANALRKYLARRFKGRGKFTRMIGWSSVD
jgi:hypothetical protein